MTAQRCPVRQGERRDVLNILTALRADEEQSLKDTIHARLQERCEPDPLTGCWIYTGCWQQDGQAKVRVGGSVYKLARVSAWLYFSPPFELFDPRPVAHKPACHNLACFNPDHLHIVETSPTVLRSMPPAWRRLTPAIAGAIRGRFAAGDSIDDLAADFHVSRRAIVRILKGDVYRGDSSHEGRTGRRAA